MQVRAYSIGRLSKKGDVCVELGKRMLDVFFSVDDMGRTGLLDVRNEGRDFSFYGSEMVIKMAVWELW